MLAMEVPEGFPAGNSKPSGVPGRPSPSEPRDFPLRYGGSAPRYAHVARNGGFVVAAVDNEIVPPGFARNRLVNGGIQ